MFHKVRELSRSLAVYGAGDVAIQVVNFLLIPVYIQYLAPADYGILGLLGGVEAGAKLFFRWGLDGAFMRSWHDYDDDQAGRQRLASTIFFFLLGINAILLVVAVAVAPTTASRLLGSPGYTLALQLVLLNTFAIGFTFIPFHVLRMERRATEFSALTFARSLATLILRLVLVIAAGMGIWGIVVADLIVTVALLAWLVPMCAALIRPVFSRAVLRESLQFGLPRLPHALAQQVMAVGDRFILTRFVSLAEVGVYSMSVSFGLIEKLFLAAFEYAWAPFYYATSREPDAARTFAFVATYVFALLVLLTAGLAAIGADLLALVVGPAYAAGGPVVTWTAVGVLLQGIYLLTSIGLNITRRTRYYPVSTMAGAGCNVALNVILIPRFGIVGAAWANAAAYGVQAVVAFGFSQRFYPVHYETGRLARVAASGTIAYAAAALLPSMPPLSGVLLRGATVVAVMAGLMAASGFLRPDELRVLNSLRRRRTPAPMDTLPTPTFAQTSAGTDHVEMAGEIVSVDVPDDSARDPGRRYR